MKTYLERPKKLIQKLKKSLDQNGRRESALKVAKKMEHLIITKNGKIKAKE